MWKKRWSTKESSDQKQLLGCCRRRRVPGPLPWGVFCSLHCVPPSQPGSTDGRLSSFPVAESQRYHLYHLQAICCRSYLGGCVRWQDYPLGSVPLMRQHLKLTLQLSKLDFITFVYYNAHEIIKLSVGSLVFCHLPVVFLSYAGSVWPACLK